MATVPDKRFENLDFPCIWIVENKARVVKMRPLTRLCKIFPNLKYLVLIRRRRHRTNDQVPFRWLRVSIYPTT